MLDGLERRVADQHLINGMMMNPFGEMIKNLKMTRIYTKDKIQVVISEYTTSDYIEYTAKAIANQRQSPLTPAEIRYQLVSQGYISGEYRNEVTVYTFHKKYIPDGMTLFLAGFFLLYCQIAQNIPWAMQIVFENEERIVISSLCGFDNVELDGNIGDFKAERITAITQNKSAFYAIEGSFSPQSRDASEVFADLKEVVDSFRLIAD